MFGCGKERRFALHISWNRFRNHTSEACFVGSCYQGSVTFDIRRKPLSRGNMANNSSVLLTSKHTAFPKEKVSFLIMQISWVILGLVSGALNILVCASVYLDKKLRTTTNYFVVSLSVADLLVAVVFIPVYIAEIYTKTISSGYFVAFILLASIFNLCAVTYERYIALTRPFQYKFIINCRKLLFILTLAWISPLCLSLLPLAWGTKAETSIHKIYLGIFLGVFIIIPCAAMVYVYMRLLRVIRSFLLRNRSRTTRGNQTGLRAGRDEKSERVFAMILASFLLCWLPVVYINICEILDLNYLITEELIYVSFYTLVLNSIVDPLIYALYKKDFKRSLRKWLSKCLGHTRPDNGSRCARRVTSFSKRSGCELPPTKDTSLWKCIIVKP